MNDRASQFPDYFVQGETVRGEPRYYWVSDRRGKQCSLCTTDRRQAERWLKKMLSNAELTPNSKEG